MKEMKDKMNTILQFTGEETSTLVDCVSCSEPIKGVTEADVENDSFIIDGVGPAHYKCYQINLAETMDLARRLDGGKYT